MTIGDLSARTGCTAPTIRYYEEIGLLPAAARTANGRRAYGAEDVRRLAFIRQARALGLDTGAVRALLAVAGADAAGCAAAREVIGAHLDAVRRRRAELAALEEALAAMAARCDEVCAGKAGVACTIPGDLSAGPSACSG